jgi:hypothetical protein
VLLFVLLKICVRLKAVGKQKRPAEGSFKGILKTLRLLVKFGGCFSFLVVWLSQCTLKTLQER